MAETQMATGPVRAMRNAVVWFLSRFWGVIIILAAWQAWVWVKHLNVIVMPSPASVVLAVLKDPATYAQAGLETLVVALLGTCLGLLSGALAAVLSWLSKLVGGLITPLALIFSAVPAVALVPVIARIMGYGMGTVVVIVTVISFFPSYIFTAQGMRSLPPGAEDLFLTYGAGRLIRLRYLALPAAVPTFMTAVRLGAASAMLSAIIAEFAMGSDGLGNVFRAARVEFDMARALGASLVAMILSVIFFLCAVRLERAVRARWE